MKVTLMGWIEDGMLGFGEGTGRVTRGSRKGTGDQAFGSAWP